MPDLEQMLLLVVKHSIVTAAAAAAVLLLLACALWQWGCSEECLEHDCTCIGPRWSSRSDKCTELKLSCFETAVLLCCCCYGRRRSQQQGGYNSALNRYVCSQADSCAWTSQRNDSMSCVSSNSGRSTRKGTTRGSRLPERGGGANDAAGGGRKSVRITTPEEEEEARASAGVAAPAAGDLQRLQRHHQKASPAKHAPGGGGAAAGRRSAAAAARARVPGLRMPDCKPVTDSPEAAAAAPRKANGGGSTLRTRLRGMRRRFFDREPRQQAPRAMPHAAPFPKPVPQKTTNPGCVQL